MVTIITAGASTITPTAVLGYSSSRDQGARTHPVLNAAIVDATLLPAGLRAGSLEIAFAGPSAEASSAAAETILAGAAVFSLVSDFSTVAMPFVLPDGGQLKRTLSDRTQAMWVISFTWQEVTP